MEITANNVASIIVRGTNPVSSFKGGGGGGGGIIGQILPKFAISRVCGYGFSIR